VCDDVNWIHQAQDRFQLWVLVNMDGLHSGSIYGSEILDFLLSAYIYIYISLRSFIIDVNNIYSNNYKQTLYTTLHASLPKKLYIFSLFRRCKYSSFICHISLDNFLCYIPQIFKFTHAY
jgi:hypothetical protein